MVHGDTMSENINDDIALNSALLNIVLLKMKFAERQIPINENLIKAFLDILLSNYESKTRKYISDTVFQIELFSTDFANAASASVPAKNSKKKKVKNIKY